MITKEFDFDLKDEVYIEPLQCEGIVKSIAITNSGIQYNVRYFDHAKAQEVYFYPEELTAKKLEGDVPF